MLRRFISFSMAQMYFTKRLPYMHNEIQMRSLVILSAKRSPEENKLRKATKDSRKHGMAFSDVAGEEDNKQRIAKVLAAAGVASRRACEALISQGVVSLNGQVVNTPATLVDPRTDKLSVRGTLVPLVSEAKPEDLHYFAIHKPRGYIVSNVSNNEKGHVALSLLDPWMREWQQQNKENKDVLPPRLFNVGRLDVASSGLIFFTNDGYWAQAVSHPSSNITKEYIVQVKPNPTRNQLEMMMKGMTIEGALVLPAEVGTVALHPDRVRVVVNEGKKHEVRILVSATGLQVVKLKRVRIGGFRLPSDLKEGAYMKLTPSQAALVLDREAIAIEENRSSAISMPQRTPKQSTEQDYITPTGYHKTGGKSRGGDARAAGPSFNPKDALFRGKRELSTLSGSSLKEGQGTRAGSTLSGRQSGPQGTRALSTLSSRQSSNSSAAAKTASAKSQPQKSSSQDYHSTPADKMVSDSQDEQARHRVKVRSVKKALLSKRLSLSKNVGKSGKGSKGGVNVRGVNVRLDKAEVGRMFAASNAALSFAKTRLQELQGVETFSW